MTAPILLLALLLAVALLVGAWVLWPLLGRGRGGPDVDASAVARAVLRERRREIEAALAHLPPDAPERRAALAEFAAQADEELGDGAPAAPAAAAAPVRRPWTAAALAALLVVPSFVLYLLAGAPQAVSPEFAAGAGEPQSLDELAADLRRRLGADPNELDGWRLLGRVELARGRPGEARDAFARALELAPNDAQAKVDLADATAQAQGAVLEGRPIELIREALALDARNPKALALAGAYQVSRRDFPAAIAHWTVLLEVLPADSEQAKQVAGFIADLRAGRMPRVAAADTPPGEAPAPGAAATGPAATGPAATGSVAQAGGAAQGGPAAQGGAGGASAAPSPAATLRGRVDLDRRLADRLRPDDTLFVVARTIDEAGRPVGPPVAVLRGRGADLPLDFVLDDRQAMSPAARLSSVPAGTQVVVVARLSRHGEAGARPGDLQGASTPIRPGAAGLRVLIDTVID
ncbi:MAG TPA: c-type cytochrome biogenesis protein CcmI [Burkholderiaceae bacterium]|nr:c-type cytochrome biogenesis protein CcmI [Burkholderiaceae bacterium]